MISQRDFMAEMVQRLESAGIPYMLVGSWGSAGYGEPRATNDVDILIAPSADQLDRFLVALGSDFYASRDAAREAFRHRRQFNVIDVKNAWKADLIFQRERPYSVEAFQRRQVRDVLGARVFVISAEDVILSKLEWAKETESERQLRDVLGVAIAQWGRLDEGYLRRWARELGVEALLDRVWAEAARVRPGESSGA